MQNAKETLISFQSNDEQIVGVHHSCQSEKIIIMCHGFTGNKCENRRIFVEAAREFNKQKIDAMRFDFYGSGDSAGEFKDSLISINIHNLKDAINWAQNLGYEKIGVLGISMGAATSILTLDTNNIPHVFVSWSAVPDMKGLFESYVGDAAALAIEREIFEYEGWLIKRDFWQDAIQYDVMDAAAKLTIPTFFVQGSEDKPLFVDGFSQFQNVVQPPADFMEIPGAGHTFQNPAHRQQAIRQTCVWLKRHF